MKTFFKILIAMAVIILTILGSLSAEAHNNIFINHNATAWNLCNGGSYEEFGHHYNITTFTLCANTTMNVTRFYNWTIGGYLVINATNINISGNITGDGRGYGGGAGSGGGAGGYGSSSVKDGGNGGTNWAGETGCSGVSSPPSCSTYQGYAGNGPTSDIGGVGGVPSGSTGSVSIYFINNSGNIFYNNGGAGGTGGSGGNAGSAGINAVFVNDSSIAPNATIGGGGSGGGGGQGGVGTAAGNRGGGGGGGGGAGQDGGAYLILIASQRITINSGAFLEMRSGTRSCSRNGVAGQVGQGSSGGGDGGNGGSSTETNCQAGSGAGGGGGSGSSSGPGGNGASGGNGAAGMIVTYAPNVTINSGAIFNVTDNVGGGSIKVLYRGTLNNSGTFSGYSSYTASNYNNAPAVSDVVITPSPATQANILTCNYTATDADSDSLSISFNWTVNNTVLGFHVQSLGIGNYTNGQVVSCQVLANDGMTTSGWISSSNLTLADSTNPLINSYTASSYTPSSTDSVTFTVNVTDAGSSISATACKLQFSKSDFDGGSGLGVAVNYTTNALTATQLVSRVINMASFGTGTLTWEYAHCFDDSGNKNSTQINQSVTITQSQESGGASGGGGGGGGGSSTACGLTIIKPATTEKTAQIYCPPGGNANPVDFIAYNTIGEEREFKFTTDREGCFFEPDVITGAGNERVPFVMFNCTCPTEMEEQFEVIITQGTCTDQITVIATPSYLFDFFGDPIFATAIAATIIAGCLFFAVVYFIFFRKK